MKKFEELGVSQVVCEALHHRGIKEATLVQEQSIPVVRSGQDVIVQAQTGTGKTLAFLLPICEKIKANVPAIQALVIAPTRELALQTAKVAAYVGEAAGVQSLVIYGGQNIERQKQKLGRNPQLIIGTPGRLLDHLRRKTIDISHVNKIVIDEADEMLHMGFIEDVNILLDQIAKDRQIMLFSATMPERVRGLANRYMHVPQQITIQTEHVTLDEIKQVAVDTTEDTKIDKLCELINTYQPYLAMVFCHTKQRVSMVTMALARRGYLVDELHGDLSQAQRTMVLRSFREAKLQILVATDIAARGLDIEGVTHVVNYDIPRDTEAYIHRIGRTGRAGQEGMAVTFVNARQHDQLHRIESGIRSHIQKQKSERSLQRTKMRTKAEETDHADKGKGGKKPAPLNRYATAKGAPHKGRNVQKSRNRTNVKTKTNAGHRAKLGKKVK
jgi:ATP-dependent RNA helicase DeaD